MIKVNAVEYIQNNLLFFASQHLFTCMPYKSSISYSVITEMLSQQQNFKISWSLLAWRYENPLQPWEWQFHEASRGSDNMRKAYILIKAKIHKELKNHFSCHLIEEMWLYQSQCKKTNRKLGFVGVVPLDVTNYKLLQSVLNLVQI